MNKIYKFLATFILLFAIAFSASSQKNYFTNISEGQVTGGGDRIIVPSKIRATQINPESLRNYLWTLPKEATVIHSSSAPVMIIPMPDGRDARFHVWESSMMEKGLADRYPQIRTFAGQGIDDPSASIKMSYDPYFGFHAQVLTPGGVYYIDPYLRGNVNFYQSYFRADYRKDDHFVCLDAEETPTENAVGNTAASGPCRGTALFAYRIAIACTGEYARAATGLSSPTVAQTLAKIVISANRINGVYETELSVRLILIAQEDQIIYLNPTSDPFTNNNPGVLIDESHNVITAIIGSENFDIGHTFSTGGGGLAGLGIVCNDNQKGRGITGIDRPYGDAYDIDYVSHEIGHQFGAGHTFNSSAGNCGGGNRSSSSAYEPGSGTTIMGYASICDNDDLQQHSDPMFHSRSFDQISNFLNSGGSCRVSTPTGNGIPVITSMSGNNSNIPIATPFTLTGTATDPDGDALTYSWEEWDLGPTTTWNGAANNTTSPLFKTRVPKTDGSRTFPDVRVINANYPTNPAATMGGLKGETLPNVARTMKFRFVVRDNKAGGGGVATGGDGCQVSEVFQIKTISGTGPFEVTVPNGGESYPGGSSQTITWNVAETNTPPISTANVKISLSTDGGFTYPIVLSASTPNDGSELLVIPASAGPTNAAKVKVEAVGNIYFDVSNSNFSITGAVAPAFDFDSPAPVAVVCNGTGTASASLSTTVTNGFSTPIQLSATGAPAGTTVSFSVNPLTPGSATVVSLNGANTLSYGTYVITVTGVGGSVTRTRDISFVVSGGTPPVISAQPASQSGCGGSSTTFSVTSTGGTSYQWQVSTDGGTTFNNIAGANTSTYSIANTTGSLNGNIYRVIVANQCASSTSNNATLSVSTAPTFATAPVNANACSGSNATFSAVINGTATYQWQVSTGGGAYTNIPGATTANLTIAAVTAGMNGNMYQVIVNNACGTITSTPVSLVVNTVASITTQPATVPALCAGSPVTLTVAGSGTGIGYQWQVSTNGGTNFTNIAGATSATYNIASTTGSHNGNIYHAVVSSQCNSVTSNNVTLTVNSAPAITTAPVNVDGCNGSNVTINSVISGTPTYVWQVSTDGGLSFTNITGATSASLPLSNLTVGMNGNRYRVIATNGCGTITSTPVSLTVNTVVTISTQPADVNICAGLNTSFSVAATGSGLGYQWQVSTDGGTTFTNVSGATSATYSINNLPTSLNNNKYRVLVTSTCTPTGTLSGVANLTVFSPVTINTAPVNTNACIDADATFSVDATGSGLTYQWQISTDSGATFTDITGATEATYTFPAVTPAVNGTQVRVIVSGVPCGIITTDAVTLTVNPVPTVTVNTPQITALYPGLTTTLTGTVVPSPAASYQWFLNGVAVPGATSETYTVNSQGLGVYTFTATAANGCVGSATNSITIRDSASVRLFIFPSPNSGQFNVAYYGEGSAYTGAATVSVFDSKGARVFTNTYMISAPYQAMPVDLRKHGKGIYWVELTDKSGKRIKTGSVSIL